MKKWLLTALLASLGITSCSQASAANLMQVYLKAAENDATFHEAIANYEVAQQNVPLSVAALLPTVSMKGTASYDNNYTKSLDSENSIRGGAGKTENRTIFRTTGFEVDLQQTVFNFTDWENLTSAQASVKSAFATYTAAVQTLIQSTIKAYFAVLQAEDTLTYTEAEMRAFYRQYTQALASYRVGVKTLTDVDNAKAAYDTSRSQVVTAKNKLLDERENLRVITNVYYKHLSSLKRLPLYTPRPNNMNKWVRKSTMNNWEVTAAKYSMLEAHYNIRSAEGGHLPNITFQSSYQNNFQRFIKRNGGYQRRRDLHAELDLNIPIYEGGKVTATVNQNIAKFRLASAKLESSYRTVLNSTRQAFLGVISGIAKVRADYQAIISNRSSLEGTEEGYKVGTQTMLNVLTAEKELYKALREYAIDRYAYINELVALKFGAGTLAVQDIRQINSWLAQTKLPSSLSGRSAYTKKALHNSLSAPELKTDKRVSHAPAPHHVKADENRYGVKPMKQHYNVDTRTQFEKSKNSALPLKEVPLRKKEAPVEKKTTAHAQPHKSSQKA